MDDAVPALNRGDAPGHVEHGKGDRRDVWEGDTLFLQPSHHIKRPDHFPRLLALLRRLGTFHQRVPDVRVELRAGGPKDAELLSDLLCCRTLSIILGR